jgi:tetratricopeptide (TPR) repeat protein
MAFHCVVGGSRTERSAAARRLAGAEANPATGIEPALAAARWPFTRSILPAAALPAGRVILIEDLHLAFPAGQTSGTRLVLTQSTYQLQRWLDWIDRHTGLVVAHASHAGLSASAPEAWDRRGPWRRIELLELEGDEPAALDAGDPAAALHNAFAVSAPERLAAFRAAAAREPGNAAVALAVSSVHMELDDLQPAQDALEAAMRIAPDWEAVPFEYGKLWLRADDLERAAEQFAEAARLMPTFSASLINLGAALAETERPAEAIAALEQALRHDEGSHQVLNNLAVIYREQGRLEDAVAAARRVVSLAPTFVFGYYNLAHALFLQGRFADATRWYADGQSRDPHKNPVQAARLAISRVASGDAERGIADIGTLLAVLPTDAAAPIREEADEILQALLQLPGAPREGIVRMLGTIRGRRL